MSDAADRELRKITNYLLKSSADCSMDKFEHEAKNYYEIFKELFPDKVIYFNRRISDVKRLMFIEEMSEEELLKLYHEYQVYGFDNISHKMSSLFFIRKYSSDPELRANIENVIIELIRDNEGDPAIHQELSWMPDLVQKALGPRRSD